MLYVCIYIYCDFCQFPNIPRSCGSLSLQCGGSSSARETIPLAIHWHKLGAWIGPGRPRDCGQSGICSHKKRAATLGNGKAQEGHWFELVEDWRATSVSVAQYIYMYMYIYIYIHMYIYIR